MIQNISKLPKAQQHPKPISAHPRRSSNKLKLIKSKENTWSLYPTMSNAVAREARDADNLQVAQLLADLNELQHASVHPSIYPLPPLILKSWKLTKHQDQKAALSLLQLPSTLSHRQNLTNQSLPTPENVFGSPRTRSTSTTLQRLNTNTNRNANGNANGNGQTPPSRPSVRPLATREESFASIRTSESQQNILQSTDIQNQDPDLLRAQTLLQLHSTRSSLLRATPNQATSYISTPTSQISNPFSNASTTTPASGSSRSPTVLDQARRDVDAIARQYQILKDLEMERDPVGMRGVLEGVGL